MTATLLTVQENKFYADTAGTVTTQQRIRLNPELEALSVDERTGAFESMRTVAPPAAAAGSTCSARAGTGRTNWAGSRATWPRRSRRPASSRAATTW